MPGAIPVGLLPHRVTLTEVAGDSGDGRTYGPPLDGVPARVELAAKTVTTADGRQIAAAAVVFLPPAYVADGSVRGLTPAVGARLAWQTNDWTVLAVAALTNIGGTVHHYELMVG